MLNNEGPLARPFVVLSGGNDEFAVLDGDAHLLAGDEFSVFDPEPGELDPGLYDYKALFYNPMIGRFSQTDPVGTKDDLNLYAYAGNNPVNRVDPTGRAAVVVGSKTPTQVAAAGGCQGFSGGSQNGGSYGTTAAYEVNNRYVCTNCAIKLLGVGGQPAAVQTETLQLFIRERQKRCRIVKSC